MFQFLKKLFPKTPQKGVKYPCLVLTCSATFNSLPEYEEHVRKHSQPLTNQAFLKELEQRLPNFTENEVASLIKLTATNMPYVGKKEQLEIQPVEEAEEKKNS